MHNFNEFINYVLDFYGQNGIYDQGRTKEQIDAKAFESLSNKFFSNVKL